MEVRPLFTAALVLIACGSLGLLAVRLSNPMLKGVGWLSAAFGASACAMGLIALTGHIPQILSVTVGNCMLLFAFTLFNSAVLELTDHKNHFSVLSLSLLFFTLFKDLLLNYLHVDRALRLEIGGFIFATQAIESAWYLLKSRRTDMRTPVWYTVAIFYAFAAFNLFRTVMIAARSSAPEAFARDWLQAFAVLVFLASALGGCFGLFWISTAQLRLNFEQLASVDTLTGVDNRRMFQLTCEKEISRCLRSNETFSLLMVDIDLFKQVNDRFGHQAGDSVLRAIALCIQDGLRTSDTLGRWGGDELVVLLPCCPLDDAMEKAERMRASVARLQIRLPAAEIAVSMSIGVAAYDGAEDRLEDVFQRADEALYRAKEQGRNRVYRIEGPSVEEIFAGEHRTKIALQ